MKKKCFIFCHGFGFDKNFWCNIKPYFTKEHCVYLDLGYFQDEFIDIPKDNNIDFIAIGHSLGVIKLLSLDIKYKHIIGLNGFTNFLGNNHNLNNKRKRELQALTRMFINSPINVLNNFYANCQIKKTLEQFTKLSRNKLINDLILLGQNFKFPKDLFMLIIGSRNDIIVPSELIYDNFSDQQNIEINWIQNNTHVLGYTMPDLIYQKIILYLKRYEQTEN